jgi:AP-2 complex subunit alpha
MMITEAHELAPLVVNSIRKDLDDPDENFNCLAIHAATNIASKELCEILIQDIYKLFASSATTPKIKKKAGLCLLRLYRKFPDLVPAEAWAASLVSAIDDRNLVCTGSSIS